MFQEPGIATIVALGAVILGIIVGFTARWTRFCTLSAVETALYGGNYVQIRMWVFAIAVAAAGTALLADAGMVDLSETVHLLPRFAIAGPVIGGLLFGLGMAAVGTCGFGSVLRAGGGDLRGLVVVVIIGMVGYMTIRGLFAFPRLTFIEPLSIPLPIGTDSTLSTLIVDIAGIGSDAVKLPIALAAAIAMTAWCFLDREFRTNLKAVLGGLVVGLTVAGGWFVSGYVGGDEFNPQPVQSLSFVAAAGSTVIYLMTFTGATVTFGAGLLFGVLLGSFLAAWRFDELRLEAFDDPREMRRHLTGAVLMGVGGVLSMGCSIGQGLSGVSTLALPSFLALLSIWGGAALGLKLLFDGWSLWPKRR
jgi:uncharacterized membrane protein YedE/YeeE